MKKKDIETIIRNIDVDNRLTANVGTIYYLKFIDYLSQINDVKDLKIKELLHFDYKKSFFSYNQSISEFMIYFLLKSKRIPFDSEVNKNSANHSNVDVCFKYKNISYNFEIKSPEYVIKDNSKLNGGFTHRFGKKEENELMMEKLKQDFEGHLSFTKYSGVDNSNLTDNKIKDCLLSAQKKFDCPNSNTCNILFVNTTTSELINYWGYIVNSQSGFFNTISDVGVFINENKKKLSKDDYNKVSAIILSNGITLNERMNSNSWDLNNSINIVLTNPFAICNCDNALRRLSEFFPHKTIEFASFLIENSILNPDIPQYCFVHSFVSQNGFDLNQEKNK